MANPKLKIQPRKPIKDTDLLTADNVLITLGDTEIQGVAAIDVKYRPGDVVRAYVHLYECEHMVDGLVPMLSAKGPDGEWSPIKKIVFENGTEFEFTERQPG